MAVHAFHRRCEGGRSPVIRWRDMDSRLALAASSLDRLRREAGVEYADARVVEGERESILMRSAEVEQLVRERTLGIGVRVLYRGAWGFGARPGIREEDAAAAAREALA